MSTPDIITMEDTLSINTVSIEDVSDEEHSPSSMLVETDTKCTVNEFKDITIGHQDITVNADGIHYNGTVEMYNGVIMPLMLNTGVLSDLMIESCLTTGQVVISPYNKSQLGNCSYNVTLGPWFFRPNKLYNKFSYLSPTDPHHIMEYWEVLPNCTDRTENGNLTYGAHKAHKVTDSDVQFHSIAGINIGDEIIVLSPGELILAHTQEYIGGTHNVTTMMKARSTMGRCGITVCKDAGWGDIGYTGIWTLEIQNHTNVNIILKVGQEIGQIVFFATGAASRSYSSKGQYQTTDDIELLKSKWSPLEMIPGVAAKLARSLSSK